MVDISVAELQSALHENECICHSSDCRSIAVHELVRRARYVPRDTTFAALDMTVLLLMDPFPLLRDSLLTVLRLGLNDDVPEDTKPLNRISRLEASFNEISNKFRMFFIPHYSVVGGSMIVFACAINRDVGVWERTLPTSVRDKYSGTMPPGGSAVIEMFPLPTWKGVTDFVNERGECC